MPRPKSSVLNIEDNSARLLLCDCVSLTVKGGAWLVKYEAGRL